MLVDRSVLGVLIEEYQQMDNEYKPVSSFALFNSYLKHNSDVCVSPPPPHFKLLHIRSEII